MNTLNKMNLMLALLAGATACSALAAEKTVALSAFNSVEIRQGINLTVKCAATSSMVVSGSADTLKKLQVTTNDKALLLVNDAGQTDRLFSNALDITLYTSEPLTALTGKAGVKIEAPACAIDQRTLTVAGSMGADIQVEGKTAKLTLDLAMGGTFNKKPVSFTADVATVRMSMGAQSSLCQVPRIDGSLSAGARMSVSPSAQVDTGATGSFGSDISTSDCS
ncbi:GIN domain-containing protein [Pseudomonas orientalis]|uniref:GIN domain-containing protein n=1 Tax=Pseudomonas orientalis TaxID=76758 RepID=UPI0032097884